MFIITTSEFSKFGAQNLELSTNPCSKFLYNLGPWCRDALAPSRSGDQREMTPLLICAVMLASLDEKTCGGRLLCVVVHNYPKGVVNVVCSLKSWWKHQIVWDVLNKNFCLESIIVYTRGSL